MGVVQAGTLWLSFTVAFNLDLILAIVCAPACLILPYWTIITIEINTNMLTMIIIIMSMIIVVIIRAQIRSYFNHCVPSSVCCC